jgi:hypothetical protein
VAARSERNRLMARQIAPYLVHGASHIEEEGATWKPSTSQRIKSELFRVNESCVSSEANMTREKAVKLKQMKMVECGASKISASVSV